MQSALSRRRLLFASAALVGCSGAERHKSHARASVAPADSAAASSATAAALPQEPPPRAGTRTPIGVVPPQAHRNELRAFAINPAGTLLATGSTTPDTKIRDFYEQGGALVMFDVADGKPTVSAPMVPGGVGWLGCPFSLIFSPNGERLLVCHDTNAISVLDVTAGQLARVANLGVASYQGLDEPAAMAWHGDLRVVIDAGGLFTVRADVDCLNDKPECARLIPSPEEHYLQSSRLAGSLTLGRVAKHGQGPDEAIGIDVESGKVAFRTPLRAYPAPMDTRFEVSLGGERAVYANPDITVVIDAKTGAVVSETAAIRRPRQVLFSSDARRLAIVTEASITLFVGDRAAGSIARAPRKLLWQELPDASPFAFSADGDSAIFFAENGDIERLTGPSFGKRVWAVRERADLFGVLWPTPETVITIGPRAIVFRDAQSGKTRREHRWSA